jgi:hypothetical protein
MGYSRLFEQAPNGWSITNHNLPLGADGRFIRLTADDTTATIIAYYIYLVNSK